jgi:hypothetical protein
MKLFQPPILWFLEGPVRSVAWVDFGLGPGNAFVSGHSDGHVIIYTQSADKVRGPSFIALYKHVLSSVAVHGHLGQIHRSSSWYMGPALGRHLRSFGIHWWWNLRRLAD